ncbi:MAG: DNA double-strand break repair nuclease NurA [Candidatus Woesearchaeota archaeon]
MKEIFEQIKKSIKVSSETDDYIIIDSVKIKISKEGFITIRESIPRRIVCFIDGGNAALISAPNFAVDIIRAAAVFQDTQRIQKVVVSECIHLARTIDEGKIIKSICYALKNSEHLPGEICFAKSDLGSEHDVASTAGVLRRILELNLANNMVLRLEEGDILVLDGTLEAKSLIEKEYLEQLYNSANKKNVLVCGLAKTTTLLTSRGDAATVALLKRVPNGTWCFKVGEVCSEMHNAAVFFVKLHNAAKYAFRLEVSKSQMQTVDIEKLAGYFAYFSKNLAFPGYPYGLVKADHCARVKNHECQSIRTQLVASLGKEFIPYINSLDAHKYF